jgi:hypothetical protein
VVRTCNFFASSNNVMVRACNFCLSSPVIYCEQKHSDVIRP